MTECLQSVFHCECCGNSKRRRYSLLWKDSVLCLLPFVGIFLCPPPAQAPFMECLQGMPTPLPGSTCWQENWPMSTYSSGTWMLQDNLHNPTLFATWLVHQNKAYANQHITFFLGTEWPNQCRVHIFLGNLLLDRQEMVIWILEMLGHFGKPGWGKGQKGTLQKTKYKIENDINQGTPNGPTFGLTVYMNQQII